jgi:3-isopropylmalate/(R)-2-methylmalate dehydratase large subunit
MRILYLTESHEAIAQQLHGQTITPGPLRNDISTDEITPVAYLSHYDATLGEFAHTGLQCEGRHPIARGALRAAGFDILVGGLRYGKGSSREHSPSAERFAGVRLVFAHSFERIYRQNADNIGLLTCTDFSLLEAIVQGQLTDWDRIHEAVIALRDPLTQAMLRAGGLLAWGRQSHSAKTLFEKIIARHRIDEHFIQADWRFIHEYYCAMANTMLQEHYGPDLDLHDPRSIVVFEDHSAYVEESPAHQKLKLVDQMQAMVLAQRRFAQRHGLRLHRTLTESEANADDGSNDAGISHAMMTEHYALPGQVVVGTDSHTPHSGALGCVAFGVGTTDMANAFMTGLIRLTMPEQIRVELQGIMPVGLTAKDVVLHLLGLPEIRAGAGVGKVFEFCGSAISAMSIDERATLTNMTAELGGFTGIVAPDHKTVEFLKNRRGLEVSLDPWMHSDPEAHFHHNLQVDVSSLSPMVASPGDPGNALPLASIQAPVPIDIAYGGSCTAGKREDFEHYHAVLAWAYQQGMGFAPGIQVYLQYGTTAVRDWCREQGFETVFKAMGVRLLQPSCGACANAGPGVSEHPDQVTVSAINRNFPGRSGPGKVWLASPPTVMASALAGRLCSFDELKKRANA